MLEHGVDLAATYSATFHALSVVDTMSLGIDVYSEQHLAELEEQATVAVEHATGMAEDASVSSIQGSVVDGVSVSKEILRHIEANDIDIVVAGTHGRSGPIWTISSVSEPTRSNYRGNTWLRGGIQRGRPDSMCCEAL